MSFNIRSIYFGVLFTKFAKFLFYEYINFAGPDLDDI